MNFIWQDYEAFDKAVIEAWLDFEARKMTGINDSFEELYRYWQSESASGKELWCKVVLQADLPVAVVLVGCCEDEFTVSELIVAPNLRGKGLGTAVVSELIKHSAEILDMHRRVESIRFKAVIYPDNGASRRAFEKSGFNYDRTHPDGDAMYYIYRKETK